MSPFNLFVSNADGHCSRPNDTLGPSELNRSDCQQYVRKMPQQWRRMKCDNETPTSIDETCCHSWCEQLTSCFSQLPPWEKYCVRMWRCRKKPRKKISIILTNIRDSSYLGRIKVKHCWAKNFPAIKITLSSEVRVFDFLVTFLVPVVVVTSISPFRECRNQSHS